MTKSVVINSFGSLDVLSISNTGVNISNDTDVIVKHTFIGVNNYDIRQRRGDFEFNTPLIPGCEAVGKVEAVGPGVKLFGPGTRVAYATMPFGAYSESQVVDEKYLIPIPDIVSDRDAAALLYKVMSAHYLLRRTFFVSDKSTILVMNGARDVGNFLVKLARHYKCKVIATVNNEEEKNSLKGFANHVIQYGKESLVEAVKELTQGEMVNVVYDPFGKGSFDEAIDCLMPLGLFVGYDAINGTVDKIDIRKASKKCNFVTFPDLFTYKTNRAELLLSANEVFALFQQKVVLPNITNEYTLDDVRQVHEDYEAGRIKGQAIISV
ncbi:MAG: zinc-binding dehydrogenase [Rickettsiales bacterium]|nr:zinc-binding dehydrogenase [Rickettsiales bacterium]